MKLLTQIITATLIASTIISCGSRESEVKAEKTKPKFKNTVVDTIHLSKGSFTKQISCNGKLRAVEKSELSFKTESKLQMINVLNGNSVKKGDLLAVIDTTDAVIEISKSKIALEKAILDLADKLIGQGYDADTTKVPVDILRNMKMTSGYNTALDNLNAAKKELSDCYLYAPFTGKVADMNSKKYQEPVDKKFCTLIDDRFFDIEFSLLEAELNDITLGQKIITSLFIDENKQFTGKISEINPTVDENGQINVRARVANDRNQLIDGMNVKIIIEKELDGLFVVPKDAVVSREGSFVVFKYADSVAVWTYVDIAMSNMESHVITGNSKKESTIEVNDIIITSGNLNLVDGSKVVVETKE